MYQNLIPIVFKWVFTASDNFIHFMYYTENYKMVDFVLKTFIIFHIGHFFFS